MKFAWTSLLLILSWPFTAQDPLFYAEVDAQKILAGSYVEVSFVLENADGSNFVPPDFSPFRILSGPNRSSQLSIINGASSRKLIISYRLACTTPGNYQIQPASIAVDGKKLTSNALTVEVVRGNPSNKADNKQDDAYILMELSDSIASIGQQITMSYVLYSRIDVHSFDFAMEPSYEGFFVQRIRNYRDRPGRIIQNGVEYTRRTLKTLALFPQQTGNYIFSPAIVQLGIPDKNSQPSFFFTTRVREIQRTTNEARIRINSTPQGGPVSYCGGIGNYTMKAGVDRRSLSTDDALTVKMVVLGDGDGNFLEPPVQSFPPEFEVYDPNVISERTFERGDQVMVEKQFEYLVVPSGAGDYRIRPELTYFDTDSNTFVTIHAGPFDVRVVQGSNNTGAKSTKDEATEELAPLITQTNFRSKGRKFLFSPAYWACMAGSISLSLLVIGRKLYLNNKLRIDPVEAKKQAAKKMAMIRFEQARTAIENQDERAFYEAINFGLYGFIADKLSIPHAELSNLCIESFLKERNLTEDLRNQYLRLLQQSQMALYASRSNQNMRSMYDDSVQMIVEFENLLS